MKVHMRTQFCLICLLTFIFHQCDHCHGYVHDHTSDESHVHSHNDYQISEEPYLKNGATELSTSKSLLPEAEHEQKYYIEKLFHRYGENGRLSYNGLEKLLNSLGIGEVKVVEIGHEDIGHDAVSHLDVLDVQEGKHLHVHDHLDPHSHTDVENETKSTVSTKEFIKCKAKKAGASLPEEHKNNHNHHLHHHTHNGTYHSHNNSHHNHTGTANHVEHGRQMNEPLTGTNTTQDQPEKKTHKQKKKKKGTKNREATIDSEFVFEQAQDEHNHVYKPDHNLDASQIHGNGNIHIFEPEEQRQVPENGQRNTHKREAPNEQINMKKHVGFPQNHRQHNKEIHEHDECLNVTQLLHYYGLNINSPISPDQFAYLCPALLYQIDSRFCIKHFTDLHVEDVEKNKGEASAWICGFISITVISLLSLLGVILIPIINQGCFKFLLNFLVALAVGTLSGDALLHLLPHSQGEHDHGSEEFGHSNHLGHDEDQDFLVEYDRVMKGLVALGGIYLLFIVEHCLRMFKHYKERRGRPSRLNRKQKVDESAVGRELSDLKLNRRSEVEWLQLKPLAGTEDPAATEGQQLNETEMTYIDSIHQSPMKVFVPVEDVLPHINKDGSYDDDHSADDGQFENNYKKADMPKNYKHNKHSHHSHGHCHSGKDMKDTGISSIAWMVIMGDGMHNFSDGLAIGAAFSAGLTGGISTSVAVFCHELPHELGDFAVLLKAGMTVNQAIVYNLLSAMMAYIGMLIGTAVGQYANNITLWIFAITAGMFLYVALVDMLPEMLHGDGENEEHGNCPVGHFILQNLGLLLGFAIMLVIALYEDKIVFDIHF
ncbi:zinc transporter ZIP10 [Mixophyes fleayi]|uniref:zinc transporter ZIP10 n=1 Tax=Mixophyes fleayi TaxID=3061075 RepID=UPI003F4E22AE